MNTEDKKIYLFANWKMYLDFEESVQLAQNLKTFPIHPAIQMTVFPSALACSVVAECFSGSRIMTGAQNIYWVDRGGYTGEVSATMFRAVGCGYALVGHSERRHLFHETNHEVREKLEATLAAGLTPVLCVGETLKEREAGQTEEVIEAQLRAAFTNLVWPEGRELMVAYEPVWAISKGSGHDEAGVHCAAAEAERIHTIIDRIVQGLTSQTNSVILFGGSVRPHTVRDYIEQPHIKGVLVGAASTTVDSWQSIVQAATDISV